MAARKHFICLSQIFNRKINTTALRSKDVYIIDGCRTPIGSFRSSLSSLTAPELGAKAISGLLGRIQLKDFSIDEVFMGQVCQANAGQAPARQAALLGGLPVSVPCTTVNKVCASGMKSVMLGSQTIISGTNSVVIAGGQESMSNVPFYVKRQEPAYGGEKIIDGIVSDGLTDVYNKCHMGICAETTASLLNISRSAQDEYAISSYKNSQLSASNGLFKKEIIPVVVKHKKEEVVVSEDEEYKRVNFEKFKTLKSVFKEGGTVTAANASTLNDGAAALLIMSKEAMEKYKLKPIARILGFADAAVAPIDFPIAPAASITKLLKLHNISADQISMWEINEAFSVVVLANIQLVKGMNPTKVNIHGGAVSMGHPIGMSGARIVLHLALNLKSKEIGVASICNGGGGASSILIEGI